MEEHLLYCECCIRNAELLGHRDIIVIRDVIRQYEHSATTAKVNSASSKIEIEGWGIAFGNPLCSPKRSGTSLMLNLASAQVCNWSVRRAAGWEGSS